MNQNNLFVIFEIIIVLIILLHPISVYAKSSNSNSGSHGQSGQSHGNSAFGHSHNISSSNSVIGTDALTSYSTGGSGGRDFIYPCLVNFQYRDFYQYVLNEGDSYSEHMHEQSLQLLQFYENYIHYGRYCGTPMLEFGDLQ